MNKREKTLPTHPTIHLAGTVIQDGENRWFRFNSPRMIRHFLQEKAKIGDMLSVTFVARRPKRTLAQNSFYYVYLGLISVGSGHTVEELHLWAKENFLVGGITEVFGTKVRLVKSTTELNISEFCEFVNRIEEATGVPIPDPKPFALPMTKDEYGKLKEDQHSKYSKIKPKIE